MDIFCCGMYRSCSTWQYEIAIEVLNQVRDAAEVDPLGYRTGPEYAGEPRANRDRAKFRIMKAHEGHPSFTKALRAGTGLGLYAHRDARDVIFSLMYKRQRSFREIVRTGMIHQVLVNDRFWRQHPQVLVQRYDEIMSDPVQAIEEIARYLGVRLPHGEAARLAAAYSKEANLQRTRQTHQALASRGVDTQTEEVAEVYDPRTLLHWNHIRPESRTWREIATAPERAVMHRLLGTWLEENGYPSDDALSQETVEKLTRKWRAVSVHGMIRCRSRELSSRYHRVAGPLKQMLGIGKAERRSKSIDMA